MATLTTVVFFFMIQNLVLVTSGKGDPQTEAHPSEIIPGLSSSLEINCSFSSMDHPEMAAFLSLILSRANSSGQKFQSLAAITQFTPNSVAVLADEKMSATGVYSQTGETFIHLTWDYPTATQAGVYKCVAHGSDILGECLELVTTFDITVDKANLNDIFEKLKQMEIHEMAMENKISELENKNAEMENTNVGLEKRIQALEYNNSQMSYYITDQDNTITGMEKNNQDLQNKNSQMSSYITDLQDTVATLQSLHRFDFIGSYQNHEYYVSKEGFSEINNVMDVCKSCMGYLAEIDNQNEFNAIKVFLDNTSGFSWVYIAGTDEASDGTWVFQSSNQPLPFTSWINSGASTGTIHNCLLLLRTQSWNMNNWYCNRDPPDTNYRYMCEIPRV